MSEKVKPGYKQTEVGVIPEEWDVIRLTQLTSGIGDGIHSTPEYVKSSGYHFINGNNLVDGTILITDNTMCVSEAEWRKLRKDLSGYTILMSINGTIGNLAFYGGERVVLGKSAAYLNVAPEISKEYIFYSLSTTLTAKYFENELTGTTIRNLSLVSLRNTPIPIPREAVEQRAIAVALSDVDALIGALDSALAKKRDLKQAAMQQLLTGQKRLPGFHGEWEVKRLGDVAEIISGGTPKTGESSYWNGSIKWCTPTDITGCSGKYLVDTERAISADGLAGCSAQLLPIGSLLLCSRATIGEVRIAACEICTNQGFKSLVCKSGVSNEFLYYKLLTMKSQMVERAIGSTFLEISKKDTSALELSIPEHNEQTAIAEVLSDMDAELAALTQRRDKTRALKQGMMQELLTGRIRLV